MVELVTHVLHQLLALHLAGGHLLEGLRRIARPNRILQHGRKLTAVACELAWNCLILILNSSSRTVRAKNTYRFLIISNNPPSNQQRILATHKSFFYLRLHPVTHPLHRHRTLRPAPLAPASPTSNHHLLPLLLWHTVPRRRIQNVGRDFNGAHVGTFHDVYLAHLQNLN